MSILEISHICSARRLGSYGGYTHLCNQVLQQHTIGVCLPSSPCRWGGQVYINSILDYVCISWNKMNTQYRYQLLYTSYVEEYIGRCFPSLTVAHKAVIKTSITKSYLIKCNLFTILPFRHRVVIFVPVNVRRWIPNCSAGQIGSAEQPNPHWSGACHYFRSYAHESQWCYKLYRESSCECGRGLTHDCHSHHQYIHQCTHIAAG